MRVVKPKYENHDRYTQRIQLDGMYRPKDTKAAGLTICYLLSKCRDVSLISVYVEAYAPERGTLPTWEYQFDRREFEGKYSNLETFLKEYDTEEFKLWRLKFRYKGAECSASGFRSKDEIGISHPLEKEVNFIPLFAELENMSYEHHDLDPFLVEQMQNLFDLTLKRTVDSLCKLQKQEDIYKEFTQVVRFKGRMMPSDHCVIVEGYSAEMLTEQYPLSVLGAYNYLIYLRENPEEALSDLKKGLPRK